MPAFLDDLARQAKLAAYAEADYRIQVRDRLAQLEAARVAAYRRLDLLRGMADAIAAAAGETAALAAGVDHALRRTGCAAGEAAWADMRAQLLPVAVAIRAAQQAVAPDGSAQAPIMAFAAFEAWYRARFGADVLSRLVDEAPVFPPAVDF